MPASTRRSLLQPMNNNIQVDAPPPLTPGTKVKNLKEKLETKETENEALRGKVDELMKALEKIELVKSDTTTPMVEEKIEENNKAKKKKCRVVPAKTAYKFFCDTLPTTAKDNKQDKNSKAQQQQELWKEADPKIRQKYAELAAADKARYQSEMDAYNEEQKALELYYEKKKQEQAMAFYEAHLEAQAALEKAQNDDDASGEKKKKKKKALKDPDAPKRCTSSYMYFAHEMRPQVVADNPNVKVTEIAKILGDMWKQLDRTKSGKGGAKKYEDMAAKDRERYSREKTIYDAKVAERMEVEQREKDARLEQERKEAMELMEAHHQSVQFQHISVGSAGDNVSVISDLSGANNTNKTAATKKKKKDPNAPKRALSAYNFFVSENRESIKASMSPNATNAELFAEFGTLWKALSERKKAKYVKMSAKDQERYAKEMEQYNATKN